MEPDGTEQITLFTVGRQQVTVDFDGGRVVSDAGLLLVRHFEQQLGILAELARRLPDPRAAHAVTHTAERLLVQQVYQILGGYPDGNDAEHLRHDALFQILAGLSPDDECPLASTSTLNRFQHAHTRRQADQPADTRPVLLEQRAAQTGRVRVLNDYLVELFVRTRRQVPAYLILDLDATDVPTHGDQQLTAYHAFYRQHQYLPLLVCDGSTGFPLAAVLRPGNAHAGWGAVDVLADLVAALRRAWPDVLLLVRGDNGLANPAMYEFCEKEGLLYAFGYSGNAVLYRRTAGALSDLETYYAHYGKYEPHVQRFDAVEDYQADGWSRPRRVVAKTEINPQGVNRRYVVTNLSGQPGGIYRGFYVQRGAVPEQPIGELKNGLRADRLSSPRVLANSWKLLLHTLAYAIVVLFREAAAAVPEVARAQVGTLRTTLFKVGAVVQGSARRLRFRLSSTWPYRGLWVRVHAAMQRFVAPLRARQLGPPAVAPAPLL